MEGSLLDFALGILYPRRCPVCGRIAPEGTWICPECEKTLKFVSGPVCRKCGKELEEKNQEYCLSCRRHKRSFEWGAALLNYNEVSAGSMARVKYKNKREYLDYYSREMGKRLGNKISLMNADAFVPVPVHPSRKRARGFNQAEELARRLSRQTGIPVCSGLLVRSKKTAPQKGLTPGQRLKNLEQAFRVNREELDEDIASVILVDDIYTTGSTIEACTRTLKDAGISSVYFLSVCIGGDR